MRTTKTGAQGEFSLSSLQPGAYDVSVEVSGFRRTIRTVGVEAGTTTTADIVIQIGDLNDSVTVDAGSGQLQYDSPSVSGVITHAQIEGLPLNGRRYLELAKLEPRLQPPTGTNRNRTNVARAGCTRVQHRGPRFTVDGGSVTAIGLGGSQMGFSQEVVQEFQVADGQRRTRRPASGRRHHQRRHPRRQQRHPRQRLLLLPTQRLSAYPGLNRDQDNPDPVFQRGQYGSPMGGPVREACLRLWQLGAQRPAGGVTATTLLSQTSLTSVVSPAPLLGPRQHPRRREHHECASQTLFARHSYDGSRGFGPGTAIGSLNAYPSTWNRAISAWQSELLGLTSVVGPTVVNDLRLSFFGIDSALGPG